MQDYRFVTRNVKSLLFNSKGLTLHEFVVKGFPARLTALGVSTLDSLTDLGNQRFLSGGLLKRYSPQPLRDVPDVVKRVLEAV